MLSYVRAAILALKHGAALPRSVVRRPSRCIAHLANMTIPRMPILPLKIVRLAAKIGEWCTPGL